MPAPGRSVTLQYHNRRQVFHAFNNRELASVSVWTNFVAVHSFFRVFVVVVVDYGTLRLHNN